MNLLEEIIANKRAEMEGVARIRPLDELKSAAAVWQPPDFVRALRVPPMGLIAEVKRKSPSAGVIRKSFDPVEIARAYESAGAQAVSVLMDQKYFGGGEDDFRRVRSAVGLPLLYKEFVVDPWQIWHAASLGASAILLIAAALTRDELARFLAICAEARLEALVEVHGKEELKKLSGLGARVIGINNRDLKTFKVSLDATLKLSKFISPGVTVISESGIKSADDVVRLKAAGVHAILVGEHLLKQKDVAQGIRKLMGKV